MNIILDAYFDCNYGDDIFIEGITSLFPMHKFYAVLEHYPEKIIRWADSIPNLYPLPENELFFEKNLFDAYVCVGGDIFPDGGDYEKRKRYIDCVKAVGGSVIFAGFSLFHEYSGGTKDDFGKMMSEADIIAPRDEESAKILREILPGKEITSMADLALSTKYLNEESSANAEGVNSARNAEKQPGTEEKRILGISVRKPGNVSDEALESYVRNICKAAETFLEENKTNVVRFFGLSDGVNTDTDIINEMTSALSMNERIEKVIYEGNTEEIIRSFEECSLVIATRFHAILTCIAKNIPFLPVSYEVKTDHLLKEIQYNGGIFAFGKEEGLAAALAGGGFNCRAESVSAYRSKSKPVLAKMKSLLEESEQTPVCKAKGEEEDVLSMIYGKTAAGEERRRRAEITELSEKNAECHRLLEEANERNEEQFKEIDELNTKNAEYFKLIEELNAKNAEFFKLIEDVNARNAALGQENERLQSEIAELHKNIGVKIQKKFEGMTKKDK